MNEELLKAIARIAIDHRLQSLILSGETALAMRIINADQDGDVMLTPEERDLYTRGNVACLNLLDSPKQAYRIRIE